MDNSALKSNINALQLENSSLEISRAEKFKSRLFSDLFGLVMKVGTKWNKKKDFNPVVLDLNSPSKPVVFKKIKQVHTHL